MSCALVNPPAALQKLGLTREAVQAMAWRQQVETRATQPAPAPREEYHSPRLINTCYLDGEQQRAKKSVLHANEAVIIGMVMTGTLSVVEIALAFGVTDQAIRNRAQEYGIRPRSPAPTVGPGLRRWLEVSEIQGCESRTVTGQ